MASLCVRISAIILPRGLATSTSDEEGLLSSPAALLLAVYPGEFLTHVPQGAHGGRGQRRYGRVYVRDRPLSLGRHPFTPSVSAIQSADLQ